MSTSNPKPYTPIAAQNVAFLGLGVMGLPMAGHLARAGHRVSVFNRSPAKAQAWVAEYGGKSAATPREAAAGASIVFACVGNDDDLRSVVLGDDGAFAGMSRDAIFVDHTTASASVARELHAAARTRGLHFIDAPVSGGQAGAVNGMLTVMCGGDQAPFEKVQPVALAMAKAVTRIGESGAGQLAKMVNQVCVAGLVQGLSEGLQAAGIELLLASTDYSLDREEQQLRALLGWAPSAIVVTGRRHTEGALQLLSVAHAAGTSLSHTR